MADRHQTAEIQLQRQGPTAILRVTGELDALAGPQLEECAYRAMEEGARHCVIDMTHATFIDSIGVGALIRSHRAAADRGSTLFLVGAHGMISQLIKVTQLDRIFQVCTTLDEALAIIAADTTAP